METYLEINLDKLKENVNKLKDLNKQAKFCAVIKANAYGMGQVELAKAIEDRVDYFAVARLDEAIALRKNSINKPIFILGYVPFDDCQKCIRYNIDIPIYDLTYAKKINKSIKGKLKVHIAIDTGHGRIGFRKENLQEAKQIKNLDNLEVIGIFSHYASADEIDQEFTNLQNFRFEYALNELSNDYDFTYTHISNSAATIKYKNSYNMVRVGLALYGIYPDVYMNKMIDLEQIFNFKTVISYVKNVSKGTPISYGRTFIADKDIKVATVPIGYADGYFRSFSNKGDLYINGNSCRVLGRVCMDQLMIDVTGLDVKIDDEVIIYKDIYTEAKKIDTIVYELMTNISLRIPRVYKENGDIVHIDNYLGAIYEN